MNTTYIATRSAVPTRQAANPLKRHFDAFCAWRIRQTLRATLDDLSDRELTDIGVTRGEIEYLIRSAPSVDPCDV